MVLGQSAATAACLAIDQQCDVQDVDIEALQSRLLADGQVLKWTGPQRSAAQRVHAAHLTALWWTCWPRTPQDGRPAAPPGSLSGPTICTTATKPRAAWKRNFSVTAPQDGAYELRLAYSPHLNRATNAVFRVLHRDSMTKVTINQRTKPPLDDLFFPLATLQAKQGETIKVQINNADTDGYVIIDAIQLASKSTSP